MIRTTRPEEASAMLARGGRMVRQSHDMVRALDHSDATDDVHAPRLPQGFHVESLDRPGAELAAVARLAYAEPHVDATAYPDDWLEPAFYERLLAGEIAGSVISQASAVVCDASGRLAGSLIATDLPTNAWWSGGPCVADLVVVPRDQGIGLGGALLKKALAESAAMGATRICLTVTEGNPAEHLYVRLGFRRIRTEYLIAPKRRP